MHVVVVDNIDSFTYNLVQALRELSARVTVVDNAIDPSAVRSLSPTHVVVSPGPGRPEAAGNSTAIVREMTGECPVLGVCLGHQCIAAAFDGVITHAPALRHGKTSPVHHDGEGLFAGLPNPLPAGRYHSLVVDEGSLPDSLVVTARTADGVVMAMRHGSTPTFGLQFHPESVLTPDGHALLANFLHHPLTRRSAA